MRCGLVLPRDADALAEAIDGSYINPLDGTRWLGRLRTKGTIRDIARAYALDSRPRARPKPRTPPLRSSSYKICCARPSSGASRFFAELSAEGGSRLLTSSNRRQEPRFSALL